MEHPDSIGILLVDDDDDVRDLLSALFASDDRFHVAGSAVDGPGGVALAGVLQPDVVVLDLAFPELEVIGEVRAAAPSARIVVVSVLPDPYTLLWVLDRGGDAYVNKGTAWSELVPTISTLFEAPELSR